MGSLKYAGNLAAKNTVKLTGLSSGKEYPPICLAFVAEPASGARYNCAAAAEEKKKEKRERQLRDFIERGRAQAPVLLPVQVPPFREQMGSAAPFGINTISRQVAEPPNPSVFREKIMSRAKTPSPPLIRKRQSPDYRQNWDNFSWGLVDN